MPIGFFSPLPLAMMIPFMATQSLAMGEAFGKSFQYGKRKISSMSNEEFNKYTITDMMNEQTADIRTLIPKLTEQMAMSQQMQTQIFAEMVKLVPAFINSIQLALTGNIGTTDDEGNTTNLLPSAYGAGDATPDPTGKGELDPNAQYYLDQNAGFETPTTIRTQKYNQTTFRSMAINELIQGINSGRFTGSDLSLAKHVLKTRQQTDQTLIPTTATAQQVEHQKWQRSLTNQLTVFVKAKHDLVSKPNSTTFLNRKRASASRIRAMARDYRSSNNAIRRDALTLRQRIANGLIN